MLCEVGKYVGGVEETHLGIVIIMVNIIIIMVMVIIMVIININDISQDVPTMATLVAMSTLSTSLP